MSSSMVYNRQLIICPSCLNLISISTISEQFTDDESYTELIPCQKCPHCEENLDLLNVDLNQSNIQHNNIELDYEILDAI